MVMIWFPLHQLSWLLSGIDLTKFTFGFVDCVGNNCASGEPDGRLNLRWLPLLCVVFGFGSVSYSNNIEGSGNYAGTLLVVGDCQATVPAARTPTTAAGRMRTPATAKSHLPYLEKASYLKTLSFLNCKTNFHSLIGAVHVNSFSCAEQFVAQKKRKISIINLIRFSCLMSFLPGIIQYF